MAVEYSEVTDLVLGDMVLGVVDPLKYIADARRDIDSKLGYIYKLPLRKKGENGTDVSWKTLPEHQVLTLTQISNKLASGKIILAMSVGQEGTAVHAYGLHLVREATAELLMFANGTIDLDAEKLDGTAVTDPDEAASRTPEMLTHDEESLLLGFENTVLRNDYSWSRPGALP